MSLYFLTFSRIKFLSFTRCSNYHSYEFYHAEKEHTLESLTVSGTEKWKRRRGHAFATRMHAYIHAYIRVTHAGRREDARVTYYMDLGVRGVMYSPRCKARVRLWDWICLTSER